MKADVSLMNGYYLSLALIIIAALYFGKDWLVVFAGGLFLLPFLIISLVIISILVIYFLQWLLE